MGAAASQVAALVAVARPFKPLSQTPVFRWLPRAAAVAHQPRRLRRPLPDLAAAASVTDHQGNPMTDTMLHLPPAALEALLSTQRESAHGRIVMGQLEGMESTNRRYAAAGLPSVGIALGGSGGHTPADVPESVDGAAMQLAARFLTSISA
jgi:hypothetical protein